MYLMTTTELPSVDGRLVTYLSSHTHDVASAEDALGEALLAALKTWPRDGVPQNPEGWLLTTARHSFIDLVRHQRVALASEPTSCFSEMTLRWSLCRWSFRMNG